MRMSLSLLPGSQTARLDVFKQVASAAPEGLLHLGIEMDSVPSSVPGPGDKKMNKSKQAKQIHIWCAVCKCTYCGLVVKLCPTL